MIRRRTLKEIRKLILLAFEDRISINEISKKTGIDWFTVERQLIYFKGMGLADEVFSHRWLRLFALTGLGKEITSSVKGRKNASKKENREDYEIKKIKKRII